MSQIPKVSRFTALRRSFTFVHSPIPVFFDDIAKNGTTYFSYIGGIKKVLVTANPKVMRHVLQKNHKNYTKSEIQTELLARYIGYGLLTNDGEQWFKQRRLIQPGFHKDRIKNLVTLVQEVIDEQLSILETQRGSTIDFYPEMNKIAFGIIGNAMFSESATEESLETIESALLALQEFVIKRARQPYMDPIFWLRGDMRKYKRVAENIESVVLEIIRDRKKLDTQPDDLLGMLINTRYEDSGEPMSEQQLLWETNILFVAGHETTANALSWMLYLLAKHPDITKDLKEEISENLGPEGLPFDVLMKLPLLNAVIMETLRMYPSAWILDRVSKEDDQYEDLKIPKGTLVIPLVYHAHYQASEWDEPEKFKPSRFLNTRNHAAYFPFGAGPRMCIGNNFAMLEMQIFLVQFLRKFDIEIAPETNAKFKALITLKPEFGMKLKLV